MRFRSDDSFRFDRSLATLSQLTFKNSRQGYANDWIAGWTSTGGTAAWDIDVVRPGRYDVSLAYVCDQKDAGSRIRVTAGQASTDAVVPGTAIQPIALRHRHPGQYYRSLVWAKLPAGTMRLTEGRTRLEVRALTKPGDTVMELKHVALRYLGR